MSNAVWDEQPPARDRLHVIVQNLPEVVSRWSNAEIVERWMRLYPRQDQNPEMRAEVLAGNPERVRSGRSWTPTFRTLGALPRTAFGAWVSRFRGCPDSVAEFASALVLKQRTGAIDEQQAQGAWARFERMVAADLKLLPVEPANFYRAAELVLHAASALRAGDALHLACAEAAGAKHMATLDDTLARNAQGLKMKLIALRDTP